MAAIKENITVNGAQKEEAIAVVLIGFPDLEPATTTTGGGPLGPGYVCKVAAAGVNVMNSQWQDGNCAQKVHFLDNAYGNAEPA